MNMLKLVSNNYFSIKEFMVSINFKMIDNGPQYQVDNFDYYCQRNFQKKLKILNFI